MQIMIIFSIATIDCPEPPENITIVSLVPPNVDLLWDRPSTADMWSFVYRIVLQNGTSAVGDTTDMRGTLSGLEAATEYAVTITAFTDSTLCPEQSINFTFTTSQSERGLSCWRSMSFMYCMVSMHGYTCRLTYHIKSVEQDVLDIPMANFIASLLHCNWYV